MIATELAVAHLQADEGFRAHAYDDHDGSPIVPGSIIKGHPTIGFGWALDLHPMSRTWADVVLREILTERVLDLHRRRPWIARLSESRKAVLYEVAYNCGVAGLLGFRKMLFALEHGDYATAARELLDSDAARKLASRYGRMARRIERGVEDGT